MFVYLTRKVKMLFITGYTDGNSVKKRVMEDLKEFGDEADVLISWNPFRCYKDNAEDVEWEEGRNRVVVCTNLLPSEMHLKASLARERYWAKSREKGGYSDDEEAQNVIFACKKEMETFNCLDKSLRQQGTKVCAKIHSKLKIPNKKARNFDAWHFYTRKLVEDNFYVYFT